MTTPEALTALADRVEREEPSWQLEVAISDALGFCHDGGTPRYTRSLDSAVTLVPEGWSISVGCSENRKHAQVQLGRSYPTNKVVTLEGRTMARALTAAALRARAADMQARLDGLAPISCCN